VKLVDKITQGMLEDFEAAIWGQNPKMGLAKYNGITARAAHDAGWVDGECDLDDPHTVARLADMAAERYRDLLSVSPQDNGGGDARPQSEAEPSAD